MIIFWFGVKGNCTHFFILLFFLGLHKYVFSLQNIIFICKDTPTPLSYTHIINFLKMGKFLGEKLKFDIIIVALKNLWSLIAMFYQFLNRESNQLHSRQNFLYIHSAKFQITALVLFGLVSYGSIGHSFINCLNVL